MGNGFKVVPTEEQLASVAELLDVLGIKDEYDIDKLRNEWSGLEVRRLMVVLTLEAREKAKSRVRKRGHRTDRG